MKRYYIILILVGFSLFVLAQNELDKCYIDVRNGDTIKTTDWTILKKESDCFIVFRLTQKNSQLKLMLKYHFGNYGVFTVADTDNVWLKLFDGRTIILKSDTNIIATKGGAKFGLTGIVVPGVCVPYTISKENNFLLQSSTVVKLRIFSSYGHIDVKLEGIGASINNAFRIISITPKKIKKIIPEAEGREDDVKEEPW